MAITDEVRQRRSRFAAYLKDAMRAAGYVRPDGEPDVPALHRMSDVPDNILRRWLQKGGDPSLDSLRRVAPSLGLPMRDLVIAAGLMSVEEIGLDVEPGPPVAPPTPEERILADDILDDDGKQALITMLNALRSRRTTREEPRRRRQA